MRKFAKSLVFSSGLLSMLLATAAYSKPVKLKYGTTEKGKMPQNTQREMSQEVEWAKQSMSQEQYERVVEDPQKARNDQERLAGLSAREIFILVDRSGSMGLNDDNPTGSGDPNWTRWDSARVASESIAEVALSLDGDGSVDVMLWNGGRHGLESVNEVMTSVNHMSDFFRRNQPQGTTPLAEALDEVYNKKLKGLLQRSEPFTVVILTDGAPNDPSSVRTFFKKVIKDNNLEAKGRETLAAFSFVRMGDDRGAMTFLQDLDDNLIRQLNVNVDIVDTKEDNFLFGTGKYQGKEGVGPFSLFWDALYD